MKSSNYVAYIDVRSIQQSIEQGIPLSDGKIVWLLIDTIQEYIKLFYRKEIYVSLDKSRTQIYTKDTAIIYFFIDNDGQSGVKRMSKHKFTIIINRVNPTEFTLIDDDGNKSITNVFEIKYYGIKNNIFKH